MTGDAPTGDAPCIHRAYDTPEQRPFLFRYIVALGLTLLVGIGLLLSFVTIEPTALPIREAGCPEL